MRARIAAIAVGSLILSLGLSAPQARASQPTSGTVGGMWPMRADNSISAILPCLGGLVERSARGPVLITLREFDDGTVPSSQNGPLNDRAYLSALAAFASLNTTKVMAALPVDAAAATSAAALRHPGQVVDSVVLDASFSAYDQRTEDRSKSMDFYLFKVQGGAARDFSLSALHMTGVILVDGIAMPGGGFRFKALLQNQGSRANISVFSDSADIGAAFARSSFQALGDMEELVVDLTVLTTVQRLFKIDPSVCLNTAVGPDYVATAEALYARLSPPEIEDQITALLFQLGYLQRPVLGFPTDVSKALRVFQARHALPPDGLPNAPTYVSLGRAVRNGESRPGGASLIDMQLGRALEAGRTGSTATWGQQSVSGTVTITQTFDNHPAYHRPCRAFQHIVTTEGRRFMQPERIACRLAEGVWATLP